jgi:hypothetical protein
MVKRKWVASATAVGVAHTCCLLGMFFISALCGCGKKDTMVQSHDFEKASHSAGPVMTARYVNFPVELDCNLCSPAWKGQPGYALSLADDKVLAGDHLKEKGTVRLAWDKANLYVMAQFEDSEILALGEHDDMPHYRLGDTCEVFLKPVDQPWFWEIWVTPKNMKTAVLWAKRNVVRSAFGGALDDLKEQGLVFPDQMTPCRLNIHSGIKTTENGWICEIALPFENLSAPAKETKIGQWSILIGRQNYSGKVDKSHRELSSTPGLTRTAFDTYEEYAILDLSKDQRTAE